MSLPKWIEDLAKEPAASREAFVPKLIQALLIAWKAIDYYRKYPISRSSVAIKAMRLIEELGNKD